jgi:hypothetical protein
MRHLILPTGIGSGGEQQYFAGIDSAADQRRQAIVETQRDRRRRFGLGGFFVGRRFVLPGSANRG